MHISYYDTPLAFNAPDGGVPLGLSPLSTLQTDIQTTDGSATAKTRT